MGTDNPDIGIRGKKRKMNSIEKCDLFLYDKPIMLEVTGEKAFQNYFRPRVMFS